MSTPALARHSLVPPEFRAFNRLVEDFFREPLLFPRMTTSMLEPRMAAPVSLQADVSSGMRFFKEDGKLVAQMDLPDDVKPEDVKVGVDGCRMVQLS